MTISKEQLTDLNYRLADVLVYIKGFKDGLESNPQGNARQRVATLSLCNWVESHLTDSKLTVSQALNVKESSQ